MVSGVQIPFSLLTKDWRIPVLFCKHRNGSMKLMYKYERIIYWSETDRCFLAVVPELPGCMADGETAQQALDNVETVMGEWIETAKELGRKTQRS